MALESCDILILSQLEYIAFRNKTTKCWGLSNFMASPENWAAIVGRPKDQQLGKQDVDLMPINLVKFNQTENEE